MWLHKNLNKILIGAIIGSTVLGLGAAAAHHKDKKGKSLLKKITEFFWDGLKEMNKTIIKTKDQNRENL